MIGDLWLHTELGNKRRRIEEKPFLFSVAVETKDGEVHTAERHDGWLIDSDGYVSNGRWYIDYDGNECYAP